MKRAFLVLFCFCISCASPRYKGLETRSLQLAQDYCQLLEKSALALGQEAYLRALLRIEAEALAISEEELKLSEQEQGRLDRFFAEQLLLCQSSRRHFIRELNTQLGRAYPEELP